MCIRLFRNRWRAVLLGTAAVFLLPACGQYGDLYLPEKPAASQPGVETEEAPTDSGTGLQPQD